jgi:hypothetical protein
VSKIFGLFDFWVFGGVQKTRSDFRQLIQKSVFSNNDDDDRFFAVGFSGRQADKGLECFTGLCLPQTVLKRF